MALSYEKTEEEKALLAQHLAQNIGARIFHDWGTPAPVSSGWELACTSPLKLADIIDSTYREMLALFQKKSVAIYVSEAGRIHDEGHLAFQMTLTQSNVAEYPKRGKAAQISTTVEREPNILAESAYDQWYQQFGKWTSDLASREARSRIFEIWKATGKTGAAWLVRQLLSEHDPVYSEGASQTLLAMGTDAVLWIINALKLLTETGDSEHIVLFLGMLCAFDGEKVAPWLGQVRPLIEIFRDHRDPDIREAAYYATEVLPAADALAILTQSVQREEEEPLTDLLRELIEEAAERRS